MVVTAGRPQPRSGWTEKIFSPPRGCLQRDSLYRGLRPRLFKWSPCGSNLLLV